MVASLAILLVHKTVSSHWNHVTMGMFAGVDPRVGKGRGTNRLKL